MLRRVLDDVLPRYDMREYHETIVAAEPEVVLAEALEMPAASDAIVSTLFRLRGIRGGDRPLRELFDQLGFAPVVSSGRARSGVAEWRPLRLRAAFALWAEPVPEARGRHGTETRTRLATETRVVALDRGARLRFGLYWLVVGPFSALIRRRWLATAKRRVEHTR